MPKGPGTLSKLSSLCLRQDVAQYVVPKLTNQGFNIGVVIPCS
jgi:hypothetical protein